MTENEKRELFLKDVPTVDVPSKRAVPYKQKDGTWKVVNEDYIMKVPDLGRHHIRCNICANPRYPECMKECIHECDNNK